MGKHKTPDQDEIFLDFMKNNSELAAGYNKGDRFATDLKWNTLADALNEAGPPTKNTAGWKKVWADWKMHIRRKLSRKTPTGEYEVQMHPIELVIAELCGFLESGDVQEIKIKQEIESPKSIRQSISEEETELPELPELPAKTRLIENSDRQHQKIIIERMLKAKNLSVGIIWDMETTRIFLKLWLQNVGALGGLRKFCDVHKEIAYKMQKYKKISALDIRAKMDTMTKKYKNEMFKYRAYGKPSSWIYFKEMHEIFKESKLVNMKANMATHMDSSSNDEDSNSDMDYRLGQAHSSRMSSHIKHKSIKHARRRVLSRNGLDLASSDEDPEHSGKMSTMSDKLLAVEEAKLAIEREKLQVMKNISDELGSIHRHFLKFYKHNS